ncbi:MAG: serine/threonine protein kinase [Cyanobacteria bacterium SZAS-4]|nr:serine/threonine protein kinase [Cyanobacteria bacterium SZAS-4]
MSLKDGVFKKMRTDEGEERPVKPEVGGKTCPACSRNYPAYSNIVVCKYDGTLLIPTQHFNRVFEISDNVTFANGRYKIEEWKGEGELSNAFTAIDTKSMQKVVVKIIKSQVLGGEPRRIRRFADMLHETIALQHPNIVTVLDCGIAKENENSLPQVYVVLEKLKAFKNLKSILRQYGPMAPYVVIETMIKACDTFEYAHSNGWLHQDVKPSNIYIQMNNEQISVKISDFGVAARMFSNLEWHSQGTKTGSIYGNAAYISPDMTFGLDPSVASDVYSIGCTMYHVLKGMPPFEGNNDFGTLMMHRDKEPKPFAEELKVPKELEAVVMKCLQKKPENRYQSFKDMAADLNAIS